MQFDSFTFLVFFVLVLAGYNALRDWAARKWFLLIASYVFYSAWNPPFLLLLLGSTTLDWLIARRIADAEDPRRRKLWVIATLLINLGVLGYFKYSHFVPLADGSHLDFRDKPDYTRALVDALVERGWVQR